MIGSRQGGGSNGSACMVYSHVTPMVGLRWLLACDPAPSVCFARAATNMGPIVWLITASTRCMCVNHNGWHHVVELRWRQMAWLALGVVASVQPSTTGVGCMCPHHVGCMHVILHHRRATDGRQPLWLQLYGHVPQGDTLWACTMLVATVWWSPSSTPHGLSVTGVAASGWRSTAG